MAMLFRADGRPLDAMLDLKNASICVESTPRSVAELLFPDYNVAESNMASFKTKRTKMSTASLFDVGLQYRQSHGLEFAKALLLQLGADKATIQLFVHISTTQGQRETCERVS